MADGQGPICVSVINMKGGVGKTTIAAMLARYSASMEPFRWSYQPTGLNLRTLAVDLDPQANLSQALMGANRYGQFLDDGSPSIVEVFNGYKPPASPLDIDNVVRQVSDDLHIIPSRFDFSDNLIGSIATDERVLARLIANSFQDKDLILIDCAPTESIFTRVAYHASHYILVPVKPEFLATIGFPLLEDSLTGFRNRNPSHPLEVIGVVINSSSDYESTLEQDRALDEIHQQAERNGWHIFSNRLSYSRGFPKLMRGDYSYSGNANLMFRRFADEFFARLGLDG